MKKVVQNTIANFKNLKVIGLSISITLFIASIVLFIKDFDEVKFITYDFFHLRDTKVFFDARKFAVAAVIGPILPVFFMNLSKKSMLISALRYIILLAFFHVLLGASLLILNYPELNVYKLAEIYAFSFVLFILLYIKNIYGSVGRKKTQNSLSKFSVLEIIKKPMLLIILAEILILTALFILLKDSRIYPLLATIFSVAAFYSSKIVFKVTESYFSINLKK